MKIVCISDTHGLHRQARIPEDADVLIHAGDSTGHGSEEQLADFLHWFSGQAPPTKILIAGNHDWIFEKNPQRASELIEKIASNIIYLENAPVKLPSGLKVWGSPCTPEFFNWAFNVPRGAALAKIWAKIPANTDILVTHGPPAGIFDNTRYGVTRMGCEDLRDRIRAIKPTLHIFGHNHVSYGKVEECGTVFINAAQLNDDYEYVNEPIIIDI